MIKSCIQINSKLKRISRQAKRPLNYFISNWIILKWQKALGIENRKRDEILPTKISGNEILPLNSLRVTYIISLKSFLLHLILERHVVSSIDLAIIFGNGSNPLDASTHAVSPHKGHFGYSV